jgi:hypothetical protein
MEQERRPGRLLLLLLLSVEVEVLRTTCLVVGQASRRSAPIPRGVTDSVFLFRVVSVFDA